MFNVVETKVEGQEGKCLVGSVSDFAGITQETTKTRDAVYADVETRVRSTMEKYSAYRV